MDEKDALRLGKLVADLASHPGYATGERKFFRRVSVEEAETIAAGLQSEVDKGVAAREAQIAAQRMVLACKRGCNGCCEEPIMIFRPEIARIVRWLEQPDHAGARASFLAAYPSWKERTGDTPAKLSALFADDPEGYIAAHIEGWNKSVLCAFNHGGDCTIYQVRPINCRNGHALNSNEFCNGAATQPAARAKFVPLDQFISRTRKVLAAAHNAIGGPKGRVEALCDGVYEMLMQRSAPADNAPVGSAPAGGTPAGGAP
jgi:Fe-S-cluster containining protein